ncbi:MAG: DUF2490 domain-containing protein [Salinivirgaceae bacterium]|nr:DUF2490 domain-containing protein [Salinivirgaceae bacterium]
MRLAQLTLTLLAGALLTAAAPATAQNTDFQTWSSIGVKKKISKKLSVTVEEELRLYNNSTAFGKDNVSASATYNLHKKLRVGGGYRYSRVNNFDDGYSNAHRLMLNVTLRHKSESDIVFSLRERFQTDWSSAPHEYATMYLRHKLQAAYSSKEHPWGPYVNVEFSQSLNNPAQNGIDRIRAMAGCEYSLLKHFDVDFAWGYQYTNRPLKKAKKASILAIGITYGF